MSSLAVDASLLKLQVYLDPFLRGQCRLLHLTEKGSAKDSLTNKNMENNKQNKEEILTMQRNSFSPKFSMEK